MIGKILDDDLVADIYLVWKILVNPSTSSTLTLRKILTKDGAEWKKMLARSPKPPIPEVGAKGHASSTIRHRATYLRHELHQDLIELESRGPA